MSHPVRSRDDHPACRFAALLAGMRFRARRHHNNVRSCDLVALLAGDKVALTDSLMTETSLPVLTTDGPRRLIVLAMLACSMLPTAAAAKGPERWVAERDSRRAALPVGNHAAIESGELVCEEFEWTLTLQPREAALPGEAKAELRVDGNAYPVRADITDKAVTIAIARDLLEPLMAGQRLEIDFSGLLEN